MLSFLIDSFGFELILILSTLPFLFYYDFRYYRIPDWVNFSAIGIILTWLLLFDRVSLLMNGVTAIFVLFLLLAIRWFFRGGFGLGDIKYCFFLALLLGPFFFFPALLVASLLGLCFFGFKKLLKRGQRNDVIAFGPFLGVGGVVGLLLKIFLC